jgi:hypothetical protein
MTPIATKNNAIILKDGKLAESCGCCGCCGSGGALGEITSLRVEAGQYEYIQFQQNGMYSQCFREYRGERLFSYNPLARGGQGYASVLVSNDANGQCRIFLQCQWPDVPITFSSQDPLSIRSGCPLYFSWVFDKDRRQYSADVYVHWFTLNGREFIPRKADRLVCFLSASADAPQTPEVPADYAQGTGWFYRSTPFQAYLNVA